MTISGGDSAIWTKNMDNMTALELQNEKNEIWLSRPQMQYSTIKLSEEGMKDLAETIEMFQKQLTSMARGNRLNGLKSLTRKGPNYILLKDPYSGFEFALTTDGFHFIRSGNGVKVQITRDGLRVYDIDGKVKDMDIQQIPDELKAISQTLSDEARYQMKEN